MCKLNFIGLKWREDIILNITHFTGSVDIYYFQKNLLHLQYIEIFFKI